MTYTYVNLTCSRRGYLCASSRCLWALVLTCRRCLSDTATSYVIQFKSLEKQPFIINHLLLLRKFG